MESFCAHMFSNSVGNSAFRSKDGSSVEPKIFSLKERVDILRFCFPFQITTMKNFGDDTFQMLESYRGYVYDIIIVEDLMQKPKLFICTVVFDRAKDGYVYTFNAEDIFSIWELSFQEALKEIGFLVFDEDDNTVYRKSLHSLLYDDNFRINQGIPTMHRQMQDLLKSKISALIDEKHDFIIPLFVELYRNPLYIWSIQDDDDERKVFVKAHSNWRTIKSKVELITHETIDTIWKNISIFVFNVDFLKKGCYYIHPVILEEIRHLLLKQITSFGNYLLKNRKFEYPNMTDMMRDFVFQGVLDSYREMEDCFEIYDHEGFVPIHILIKHTLNNPFFVRKYFSSGSLQQRIISSFSDMNYGSFLKYFVKCEKMVDKMAEILAKQWNGNWDFEIVKWQMDGKTLHYQCLQNLERLPENKVFSEVPFPKDVMRIFFNGKEENEGLLESHGGRVLMKKNSIFSKQILDKNDNICSSAELYVKKLYCFGILIDVKDDRDVVVLSRDFIFPSLSNVTSSILRQEELSQEESSKAWYFLQDKGQEQKIKLHDHLYGQK